MEQLCWALSAISALRGKKNSYSKRYDLEGAGNSCACIPYKSEIQDRFVTSTRPQEVLWDPSLRCWQHTAHLLESPGHFAPSERKVFGFGVPLGPWGRTSRLLLTCVFSSSQLCVTEALPRSLMSPMQITQLWGPKAWHH